MLLACHFFIDKCSTWRSSQSVNNQSELSKILRPGHGCFLYSFLELKHLSLLLSFLFGVPFGVPSFTFLGSWKSHGAKNCQRHKEQWLIKFFCLHWIKPLANNITYTTWTYKENPLHVVASSKIGASNLQSEPEIQKHCQSKLSLGQEGVPGYASFLCICILLKKLAEWWVVVNSNSFFKTRWSISRKAKLLSCYSSWNGVVFTSIPFWKLTKW